MPNQNGKQNHTCVLQESRGFDRNAFFAELLNLCSPAYTDHCPCATSISNHGLRWEALRSSLVFSFKIFIFAPTSLLSLSHTLFRWLIIVGSKSSKKSVSSVKEVKLFPA